MSRDTIFAQSSGAGRAGVTVFRLSGPDVRNALKKITQRRLPRPRFATLRALFTVQGEPLDEALVLFFEGPNSFTGEDVCEFHVHGSPAVAESLAKTCLELGLRQAEPGEFTRRAFDNGKMDLTEAEGLADLIDSDTDMQRRQALRQMQGGLKDVYEGWRERLVDVLALIEGAIDFPDEGDVPDALSHAAHEPLLSVIESMDDHLADGFRGEAIRQGLDIAIIGPPNAGKSSLINYLTGRDTAIVSETAGTTRDIVDAHFEISGLPVRIADTAGLRVTDDEIEAEGVKRALARSEAADIRIGVVDAGECSEFPKVRKLLKKNDIILINKIDISTPTEAVQAQDDLILASVSTGVGMDAFTGRLEQMVRERFSLSSQPGLTRARHRDCVSRGKEALTRASSALSMAPELAGDDVRSALHAIKELAGETDIEAVLGAIFSRFCIGK